MKKRSKLLVIATLLIIAGTASVIAAEQDRRSQPRRGGQGQGGRQMGSGGGMMDGRQMGPGSGGMMGGSGGQGQQMQDMMLTRMLRGLKLTKEQQTEVKDIQADSKEKGQELQHNIMGLTRKLQESVMNEANPEKIMDIAKNLGAAMGQQAVQKVKTTKQIKAVLTEEQLEKLEDMQVQMRERMEQMHEQAMQRAHGDNEEGEERGEKTQRKRPERGERTERNRR